jgi:hypothetical protein
MTKMDHSLRPQLSSGDAPPLPQAEPLAAESAALDAATVAYVLAAQPHFEGLKQAAGQLGGLLVLAAAGSKSITQEHAMLESARRVHAEAADGLACLCPPARAAHHHHHLGQAASAIGAALVEARRSLHAFAAGQRDVDGALWPLKLGHRHLGWAANALPGFEMVSFQQACCAGHGGCNADQRN